MVSQGKCPGPEDSNLTRPFTPIRANLPLADHSCGLPADELSWLLNEYKKHLQAIINVDDRANAGLTLSHFRNPTNGHEISN